MEVLQGEVIRLVQPHTLSSLVISVTYPDGEELFETVTAFRDAIPRIEPGTVEGVHGYASIGVGVSASVLASSSSGISVSAQSPDRIWAHGTADVLEDILKVGALPEVAPRLRVFKWWEVLGALAFLLIPGALIFFGATGDGQADLLFVVGIPLVLAFATLFWSGPPQARNAHFSLVPRGQEGELTSRPAQRGPIVKFQEWIRRHLVLNAVLFICMGIAINKLSDLI
jgi:hypothetical protein